MNVTDDSHQGTFFRAMAKEVSSVLLDVSKANNQFAIDLYKTVSKKDGNVLISPMSAHCVLALAYLGAKGETAREMCSSLKLPEDHDLIKDGFFELMSSMKSTDNMILEMANKIFSHADFPISCDFKKASKKFLAEAEELDFVENTEVARLTINSWVEDKTKQKIKELIPQGALSESTKLVLVNAVYFKGKWKLPFNSSRTIMEPFHLTSTITKDVQMMHIKDNFKYGEIAELNCKLLELPYEGNKMSMVVLLPNEIEGMTSLEESLSQIDIFGLLKQHSAVEVQVALPRFKIEETTDLNDILQKLGMTTMFDMGKADFSGIKEGLYVSKVLQKAFIEVNEEGSEAAAATGMIMVGCCAPMMPIRPNIFKADHPFEFFLLDGFSQSIIFQGRVRNL